MAAWPPGFSLWSAHDPASLSFFGFDLLWRGTKRRARERTDERRKRLGWVQSFARWREISWAWKGEEERKR